MLFKCHMAHCLCWPLFLPDLTPPPAPAQSRHGLETGFQNASRCRGPGCGAVGKVMLEGYCDKCYVKEQSARLNQVANRTSPPLVGTCHTFITPHCSSHVLFFSCVLLLRLLTVLSILALSLYKSVNEQQNPDLRSNPRPRLSAGGVAAVMCPRVAQTSAQSATRVVRAESQEDGRRRPKKSRSSGAGHKAVTTTPTKRNRATATSVTTSNRFTAADHI